MNEWQTAVIVMIINIAVYTQYDKKIKLEKTKKSVKLEAILLYHFFIYIIHEYSVNVFVNCEHAVILFYTNCIAVLTFKKKML